MWPANLLALAALAACGRLGFTHEPSADDASDSTLADGSTVDVPEPNVGTTALAMQFGGTGNEEGYDIAVTAIGTVFVTGTMTGNVTFGGTPTLVAAGGEDSFLTRFSATGSPEWAIRFGSTGDDRAQAVVVDSMGRSYVCGLFTGTVNFGTQSRTANGMWDAFLAAYDVSGTLRWVRSAGGAGADFAYDLALDGAENVIMTGYYEGAVDFGAGPLPVTGVRELFVAKYDQAGTLAWARGFGSAGNDTGLGIGVRSEDNIVVTGSVGGAIDFGGGAMGTPGGSFALELSPAGSYVWARGLDGMAAWDLAVAPDDTTVLASRNFVGADLGTGVLPAPMGTSDAQVISIAADHSVAWHHEFGGTADDLGLGITVDAYGNSYSIGLGGPAIDFGAGAIQGGGMQDVYVVSHHPDGSLRWARLWGGGVQDRGYSAAVAPDGGIYVTGRFSGTADFGGGAMLTATANDMFLVKLE